MAMHSVLLAFSGRCRSSTRVPPPARREVFPAGTRQEVVLAVRMNDVDGPAASSIVSEQVPATC